MSLTKTSLYVCMSCAPLFSVRARCLSSTALAACRSCTGWEETSTAPSRPRPFRCPSRVRLHRPPRCRLLVCAVAVAAAAPVGIMWGCAAGGGGRWCCCARYNVDTAVVVLLAGLRRQMVKGLEISAHLVEEAAPKRRFKSAKHNTY